jgi:hypothetical protein
LERFPKVAENTTIFSGFSATFEGQGGGKFVAGRKPQKGSLIASCRREADYGIEYNAVRLIETMEKEWVSRTLKQ